MATRRVSRKKPVVEPPAPKEESSEPVRQVVEEVSEEKPGEIIEEIKEDAQKIEKAAQELEEALPETEAPELPSEAETKEREVVSELYKPTSVEITPEITAESASSTKSLLVWSLVVIGIALLTGGTLLIAVKGLQGMQFVAQPTPTPISTPTPQPTPVVNRSDIKIQVLNGGGVSGSAGKMKAFLEEKGYSVEAVGNAEEFTFEETEVHVKADKEAFLEVLKSDLADSYTIGSAAADLAEASSFEVQVIVGKK